jgi:hypothetical protein
MGGRHGWGAGAAMVSRETSNLRTPRERPGVFLPTGVGAGRSGDSAALFGNQRAPTKRGGIPASPSPTKPEQSGGNRPISKLASGLRVSDSPARPRIVRNHGLPVRRRLGHTYRPGNNRI